MYIVDFIQYKDKSTPSFFLDNGDATTFEKHYWNAA